MFYSVFTVALLSSTAFAFPEKRQATDAAQFTSAANQLISAYIPSTALPALESAVSAAASSAKITGDAASLIHDALLATSLPGWFVSAVPVGYSTQIAALESNINILRGTAAAATGPSVPVIITVTTTDSSGNTVTTSVTTTAAQATGTESAGTDTTATTSGGTATT
jgi:hypothetical protein